MLAVTARQACHPMTISILMEVKQADGGGVAIGQKLFNPTQLHPLVCTWFAFS
jgi:hypothetical protein